MTLWALTAIGEDAPASSASTGHAELAPEADAAPPKARARLSVQGELSRLQTQRRSPASSDTTQRPRIDTPLRDAPRGASTAGHVERRGGGIEVRSGPDDAAQIEVEYGDESVVVAEEDGIAPELLDVADRMPPIPTPNNAATQASATAPELAPHDRPRQRHQSDDGSAEADAQGVDTPGAAVSRRIGDDAPIGRLQRASTLLDQVEPIAAARALPLASHPAIARGFGLRLLAALIVVGAAIIALSLLAMVDRESDDARAEDEAAAETAPSETDTPAPRVPP
jgi:hypothetical protein